MAAQSDLLKLPVPAHTPTGSLEGRLEHGEVIDYTVCPFPLPEGDDRQFLLEQRPTWGQKNISYDPHTGRAAGFRVRTRAQAERMRDLLAGFSRRATGWLADTLPGYAGGWKLDQVTFRAEEEATRRLPLRARNDRLHVDAFPSRPTNGCRILRLFVNMNPTEPRVWVTSEPFPVLFVRFAAEVGLPGHKPVGRIRQLKDALLEFFQPRCHHRSAYDKFMLRFHDFLKANREFQENSPKRYWTFPPGSAWLAFTDTTSHAVLRGRYALEHSYFVAPSTLAILDESPAFLLEGSCGIPVLNRH